MAGQTFREIQTELTAIDPDVWLGQLVWYGVSDVNISHQALTTALIDNGLAAYLPRLPSDVDVFRRVASAAQRKRVPRDIPGTYDNYLMRDIPMDDKFVYKLLVKETVEPGGVSYETQLCEIRYRRSNGIVSSTCTTGDVMAQTIVSNIETTYTAERGTLNSYAVREGVIRKILIAINALNVRGKGGGVYFVSREHQDVITGLEGFAAAMPGTVLFEQIPLLDDGKRREMLKKAFENETLDEIERLVGEIATLEKAGTPIGAAKVASYMRQMETVKSKASEVLNLLETSSDTVKSSLDIFQRQIMRLAGLVTSA